MEASEKDFTLKFSFISSAKQQWMEAQCVLVKPTIIIPKVCKLTAAAITMTTGCLNESVSLEPKFILTSY